MTIYEFTKYQARQEPKGGTCSYCRAGLMLAALVGGLFAMIV